jgi:hypothetical protein
MPQLTGKNRPEKPKNATKLPFSRRKAKRQEASQVTENQSIASQMAMERVMRFEEMARAWGP